MCSRLVGLSEVVPPGYAFSTERTIAITADMSSTLEIHGHNNISATHILIIQYFSVESVCMIDNVSLPGVFSLKSRFDGSCAPELSTAQRLIIGCFKGPLEPTALFLVEFEMENGSVSLFRLVFMRVSGPKARSVRPNSGHSDSSLYRQ